MINLSVLSDHSLIEKTKQLVKTERETTTEILLYLLEIERRKLYCDYQCSSLFDFCIRILGYSEGSAQRRIQAMRLIRDIPEVEKDISSGKITLSVAAQAQSFFRNEAKSQPLSTEEKKEVLSELEGKSTRAAEKTLLQKTSSPELHVREQIKPISQTHSQASIVVPNETLEDLEKLRGLLAHTQPNLTLGELVAQLAKDALKEMNPSREPNRKTKTAPPAPAPAAIITIPSAKTSDEPHVSADQAATEKRTPSAALRRAVFQRDQNRCTNCNSTHALEVDHVIPWSLSGPTTLENLRLLCRNCNQRHARSSLGVRNDEGQIGSSRNQ